MINVGSFDDRVAKALVQGGFITEAQLDQARQRKGDLLETLVSLRFIGRETLVTALSFQLRVPVVDLKQAKIDPAAIKLLPEQYARQYGILPLDLTPDGYLRVATKTPNDFQLSARLSSIVGRQVRFVLALGDGLDVLIDRFYAAGAPTQIQPQQPAVSFPAQGEVPPEPAGALSAQVSQMPTVNAVEFITLQAVKRQASDMHLVPEPDSSRVLFRIDGVLQQMIVLPLTLHQSMVSRIKVLAGLDIAESRRPQDGSFNMQFGERRVDFRVATTGTVWGEMMVVRILQRSGGLLALQEVGIDSAQLEVARQLLSAPHGLLLVSGPTGSGKTTFLYAAVLDLVQKRGNIMTVEDPVEYRMEQVNQIEVNRQAGIDFAAGLKAVMRLDPDVILVGEIRDVETAKTAVAAAMTGHLVLASIHSNDAASAIIRLIELGAEDYLVASSILGAIAQRLVRKVCSHCTESGELGPREGIIYEQEMQEPAGQFALGRGCNFCGGTGYSGRTGVFEVLAVSAEIRRLIRAGSSSQEIQQRAIVEGMAPLRTAGFSKAKRGVTTVEEVLRNVYTIE